LSIMRRNGVGRHGGMREVVAT